MIINLLWGCNPVYQRLWIERIVGATQSGFAVTEGGQTLDFQAFADASASSSADFSAYTGVATAKTQEVIQLLYFVDAHANLYGKHSAAELKAASNFATQAGLDATLQSYLAFRAAGQLIGKAESKEYAQRSIDANASGKYAAQAKILLALALRAEEKEKAQALVQEGASAIASFYGESSAEYSLALHGQAHVSGLNGDFAAQFRQDQQAYAHLKATVGEADARTQYAAKVCAAVATKIADEAQAKFYAAKSADLKIDLNLSFSIAGSAGAGAQ